MNDPVSRLESLLRLAGERDQPSAEGTERAREAARRSWQSALNHDASPGRDDPRRARPWRTLAWAIAAGFALVVTAAFWPRGAVQPVAVAKVSALSGDVRVVGKSVTLASVMRTGEVLSTAEGRVALAVGDALSLRVDHQSRLRFDGAGSVTLLQGAVYVDSGGLNAHTALRIDTPAGEVRHVGTQFQVSVTAAGTRVQVREGRVALTPVEGAPLDLAAGDLADLGGGRRDVRHGQSASGDAWEWAAATAPPFDIENRPLSEFLAWLAREHGWQLRYLDAAVQSRARDIRLHGSLANLHSAAMLERTALITGVPLSVQDGSLRVGGNP